MTLKYFYDLMSQPARAVYIFLKLSKIPFESVPVALRKGEHLTEDFKEKCNKYGKIPFIHRGDFKLAESIAIVRYLSREFRELVPDNLYPRDSQKQALVDEYLEWQHNNIRAYGSLYFIKKWATPLLTGIPADPKNISKYEANLVQSLDNFERLFLSQKHPFIVEGDKISFADILAVCELEQPGMAGFDVKEGRPKIKTYMENVQKQCSPFYDEANKVVRAVSEKTKSGVQAKL